MDRIILPYTASTMHALNKRVGDMESRRLMNVFLDLFLSSDTASNDIDDYAMVIDFGSNRVGMVALA